MSRRHTELQGRAETVPIIKLPYLIQGFESQFDLFVERRQLFEKLKLSEGGKKNMEIQNNNLKVVLHTNLQSAKKKKKMHSNMPVQRLL